jgi:hypothetical protein
MASQSAWDQGWAIGARGYGGVLGRGQQLNEEEFKARATELGQQLGMLRQKLGQHPAGSGQHSRVVSEMQSRLAEIRELYHPDRHPNAIQRFSHLLTDALKLTSPQARIKKEAARRAAASAEDEHQAQEIVETAPEFKEPALPELDPEETHMAAEIKAGIRPRAAAPKPMEWKPVGKPIRVGGKTWSSKARRTATSEWSQPLRASRHPQRHGNRKAAPSCSEAKHSKKMRTRRASCGWSRHRQASNHLQAEQRSGGRTALQPKFVADGCCQRLARTGDSGTSRFQRVPPSRNPKSARFPE